MLGARFMAVIYMTAPVVLGYAFMEYYVVPKANEKLPVSSENTQCSLRPFHYVSIFSASEHGEFC